MCSLQSHPPPGRRGGQLHPPPLGVGWRSRGPRHHEGDLHLGSAAGGGGRCSSTLRAAPLRTPFDGGFECRACRMPWPHRAAPLAEFAEAVEASAARMAEALWAAATCAGPGRPLGARSRASVGFWRGRSAIRRQRRRSSDGGACGACLFVHGFEFGYPGGVAHAAKAVSNMLHMVWVSRTLVPTVRRRLSLMLAWHGGSCATHEAPGIEGDDGGVLNLVAVHDFLPSGPHAGSGVVLQGGGVAERDRTRPPPRASIAAARSRFRGRGSTYRVAPFVASGRAPRGAAPRVLQDVAGRHGHRGADAALVDDVAIEARIWPSASWGSDRKTVVIVALLSRRHRRYRHRRCHRRP